MASPVYQGTDQYGATTYIYPGGDWRTSITLSAPSFGAATCLVIIAAEYVRANSSVPFLHHWRVPPSWTFVGQGGNSLSGGTSTLAESWLIYQCTPGQVAGASLRPELADNSFYNPVTYGALADRNYWRVFVVGFSPAKIASGTATGGANGLFGGVPQSPPNPLLGGSIEGTWVEFAFGSYVWGGAPSAISVANGWTQRYSEANFKLATKAFAATGSTPAVIWSKPTASNAIAAMGAVTLDTPPPPEGGFGVYRDDRVHAT